MKSYRNLIALSGAALLLAAIADTWAQYTVLHQFSGGPGDGDSPSGSLTLDGSTLYGTCNEGGGDGFGTVFRINTDGTGYTTLHSFAGVGDGAGPGSLILGGSTLYGTTSSGFGFWGDFWGTIGTVFKISTDGSGYATLHFFASAAGASSLTLDGSTLYGTCPGCPSDGFGSVFRINTDGSGYTNLYLFAGGLGDGAGPNGSLTLDGSTLYGTCSGGGITNVDAPSGLGTVFKINTDGSGYTTLHFFAGAGDGAGPNGSLALIGSSLYGMTRGGGNGERGTVFRINTDGSSYTNLYSFGSTPGDGANPYGSLAPVGSTLYGMTFGGGSNGFGTVFRINTDGSGYTNLYIFTPSDGGDIYGSPTLVGETLYGETGSGNGNGTVFELALGGGGGGGCTCTLNAASATLPAKGGSKDVSVKATGTDCSWMATSNAGWITITSGSSGTGNAKVDYTVLGNTNTSKRAGTITIAGQTFTVNQAAGGCTFKLSPKTGKFKAAGGLATVKVKANLSDCAWTAVSTNSFITITAVGNGTFSYAVSPNTNTTVRSGSITVAGRTFTVTEAGAK